MKCLPLTISLVWFEMERARERQWQQRGLGMFLFVCVHHSHQFPSLSEEQYWIEDCLMSSSIVATDLTRVINPLCPVPVANWYSLHQYCHWNRNPTTSFLMGQRSVDIHFLWLGQLLNLTEDAKNQELHQCTLVVKWQTEEASWVKHVHFSFVGCSGYKQWLLFCFTIFMCAKIAQQTIGHAVMCYVCHIFVIGLYSCLFCN